jgi:excisionase family DNA binding protein
MKVEIATTVSAGKPAEVAPAPALEPGGRETATAEAAVEPYVDKHEVARRMGCTTRTVDNMMRRRMIPFYKLGYRVAFRWSEIQNHLAQTCRVSGES